MENKPESSGGGFGALLAELKRRHVVRAVVAYSAVAFVVLQAAQIIQEAWEFPEWVLRLVVVFTLLGFPLVLALAWVYEITPLGLRTTRELDGESGVPESGGLPRVAFLIVTVVVVGISGWWWVRSTVGDAAAAGAAADGSAFPAALTRQPGDAIRSVAVLPFESFSPPPEGGRDYFAEGMHEALISQLSQVDFLRVLSRTSSSQIDTQGRSIPQIGAELGVDAIIEGSVLAAEGRVRITVQLIEVATDDHIWAQNYERDLVDIIALQREVAEEVVDELRGELAPTGVGEQQVTAAIPTATDPEAADALMKGRMGLADFGSARFASSSLDSVALHFQTAIRRDSSLAPAYRGLAQVYLMKALAEGTVPSPADIRAAWENAGRALALDPNSRETQEVIAHVGLFGAEDLPPVPGGPFPQDIRMGSDSLGVIMVGDQAKPMLSVTEPGRQLQFAWARREAGSESPDAQMRAAHRFVSSGHPEEAREVLQRVVRIDPRNFEAWDELEQIHRVLGDLDAVVNMWRDRSDQPPPGGRGSPLSSAPTSESIRELERAVQRDSVAGYWNWRLNELKARQARGARVSSVELADAYAGVGDAENALTYLERGARDGDPRVRSVRSDPVWDPFRRDPRYARALEQAEQFGPPPQGGGRGGGGRGGPPRPLDGQGRGGGSGREGGGLPNGGGGSAG